MRTDINHAAHEPLVTHGRHRDQHLPIEVAALGTPALLGTRRHFPELGHTLTRRWAFFAAGRGLVVLRARLASELHGEMLPDCRRIANDGRLAKFMHDSRHTGLRSR